MVLGTDIASRKEAYPDLKAFDLKGGFLYGPIPSRRLGFSLGVNILPLDIKVCTWDCLYCQCGWTDRSIDQKHVDPARFPTVETLTAAFEEGFATLAAAGRLPESITFSGNGEPTLHPRFEAVVDALLAARDRHLPASKTSVLSNGERLDEATVRAALDRLDRRCMKLDAGDDVMTERVDRPLTPFRIDAYIEALRQLKPVTIQSFFMQGSVDNTTPQAVDAWAARLKAIAPCEVHVYSLDRVPPAKGIRKAPRETLEAIAAVAAREAGCPARVFA